MEFFKDATRVPDVEFPCSLKTAGCFRPYLVTFSDGSDDAFGAVVYVQWEAAGEIITSIRLIEAKGKLCPLNLKGDTVRSEMCGAVTAARLSVFVEQNSRIMFTKILHFVDSKF